MGDGESKMRITITLINCITEKQYDIQMDQDQKIATTIRVLQENLPEVMEGMKEGYLLRSQRSQRRLNPECSYRQENIFHGDVIRIENN